MADHRLPGMSISAEHWEALGQRAQQLGVTRTELIRRAIARLIDEGQYTVTAEEYAAVHHQLSAIRAVLDQRHTNAA